MAVAYRIRKLYKTCFYPNAIQRFLCFMDACKGAQFNMTNKENALSATLVIAREQLQDKQLVIEQHERWQRKALEALGDAIIAMGRAGANHDLQHPQRKAWEACRAMIVTAVQP